MAILNNILTTGAGETISSLANYAQLVDLSLQVSDLNNTQLLKKLMSELLSQDRNLENLLKHCERIIFQFEKSLANDKIIIEQNEKIISLLERRNE